MRVGINATCLNDRPSGARQRFVGIFSRLLGMMADSQFVLFEPADCRVGDWFPGAPNLSVRRTPLHSERRLQRLVRGWSYWPGTFSKERFDLFEALHMPVVRPPSGKLLLTIHDMRGLHAGKMPHPLFRRVLQASLAQADHVVTVSKAMREELLGFDNRRQVSVVYNGLERARFEAAEAEEITKVLDRLRLPQRFLLAVGHFEPRKNYLTLVQALGHMHRAGNAVPLVIVGNESGDRARVQTEVHALGLQSSVYLLAGVSDADLRCLYGAASMLVFPSRYEGFGIPLLEAMAAGLPVAASDIPVFKEILGEAGAFFDPHSSEDMAATIRALLSDTEQQERMIAAGLARVRDFDYDVLAAGMAAVYKKVTGGAAR